MKTLKYTGLYNRLSQLMIIAVLFVNNIYSFPFLSTNDAFQLFPWTRKQNDDYNYGYNLITKINSQETRNDSIFIKGSMRVAGLPEWTKYAKTSYCSLTITFTSSKPTNIVRCSPIYNSCPWLNRFSFTLDKEKDTINFLFPVPDQENPYHKYDFFTIAVNDSIHLQFQGVQDTIFMGSLLNNKHLHEPDKWLIFKGAIMVRTSSRAPFKIHNIEFNANDSSKKHLIDYLGFDLSRLSTDCDYYGIDFVDTNISEHVIRIKNLKLQETNSLNTDSVYKITWSTEGKEAIKVCSLYVKYDNDPQWVPIGHTSGNIEQLTWFIPDNGKTSCTFQIKAIGYEGQNSSDTSNVYAINRNSLFRLEATALSNSTAQIKWTSINDTTDVSGIVIAYGTNRSVLLYNGNGSDTLQHNFQTKSDTIYNLETGALYYFAAFALTKDGKYVSAGSLSIDSVKIIDYNPPVNNFRLTSTADSSRIILFWESISDIPTDVQNVGIFMCRFRYPVSKDDPEADSIIVLPAADSNYTIDNLKSGTYYFALMVSDSFGNWSSTTDNSITRVFIGNKSSSIVEITPSDTQHLFNDSLLVWTTSNISYSDTIDLWEGPKNGFIDISQGFLFRNGENLKSICVQVPYSDSIKPDIAKKIRLYSYDIYKDGWMLSQKDVKIDTVRHTVSAEDICPYYPFMFLIDTQPPVINFLSHSNTAVNSSQRINDTLSVNDNIKNYNLQFVAGSGDVEPWDLSLYVKPFDTLKNLQILELTIPPGIANSRTGLRSYFTVSDEANELTVNLSRPVSRVDDNSDNFLTAKNQWTPITVSAVPDHPELESLMKNSSSDNWKYDTKELRIIKWSPGHSQSFDGGWVEYGNVEDSLFRIMPGNLFWIRTKSSFNLDFGSATVPQLVDTATFIFNPEQWTDFSNPFPFDIYIGDILQASAYMKSAKSADSLDIYIWDNSNGNYKTNQVYLSSMPYLHESADTIKSRKPYAIYNPGKKPVILCIPPTCIPVSKIAKDKETLLKRRQSSSKQWSLRIDSWGSDNASLPSVYCGHIPGLSRDITYQTPPSFSQQRLSIYDSKKRVKWGSIVSQQKSESGFCFELLFENNASSPVTMRSAMGKIYNVDKSFLMKWYDPEKDVWTEASDTMSVSVEPKQNQIQILAIGNDQYFKSLGISLRKNVLALRAVYPNPFRHYLTVQFSLPYKSEKVSFYIYNLAGQVLWRKDMINPQPGPSTLKMDIKLATGMYVLQMKANVEGAGSPKVFNRVVMCTK